MKASVARSLPAPNTGFSIIIRSTSGWANTPNWPRMRNSQSKPTDGNRGNPTDCHPWALREEFRMSEPEQEVPLPTALGRSYAELLTQENWEVDSLPVAQESIAEA